MTDAEKDAQEKAEAEKATATAKAAAQANADKTAQEKAAQDRAAADKTAQEKAHADAQAAQKLAQVAQIVGAPPPGAAVPTGPFQFAGRAGGQFAVYGSGFGSSGVLTLDGRPVSTTRWTDRDVRGETPADLKPGRVTVSLAGKTAQADLR